MSNPSLKVKAQDEAESQAFGDSRERILAIRLKECLCDRLNEIAKQRNTSVNLMVRELLLDFAKEQEPPHAD